MLNIQKIRLNFNKFPVILILDVENTEKTHIVAGVLGDIYNYAKLRQRSLILE